EVARLFVRNRGALGQLDGGLAKLRMPLYKAMEWRRRNTLTGSSRNISAHYDLGNDFFGLFLDDSMMYSSAIYNENATSLEAAQRNKLDIICQKLDLKPGEHLLEIGTGWGAMAIHAAKHYGVKVTTTTISKEQHDLAKQRIEAEGLQNQIELLQSDYRELNQPRADGSLPQYDKLVSVEMIEAVGHEYYPRFLKQCQNLVKPNGQILIQAITTTDQIYDSARKETDFIRRYIFPGGNLPTITHLLEVATRHTDLKLFHLDDFASDYAQTLADWRQAYWANIDAVRQQGYSETFIRMWDYYLAICEAAFAEHHTAVVHMLFTRPACLRERVKA
ncbi:MAG: class I SAM-dependent methyltransferase, partial [Nevskiales bacterium]